MSNIADRYYARFATTAEVPTQRPVAVYGSLRSGGGNDRLWHGYSGMRTEMVRILDVRLKFQHDWFPYAIREQGAEAVGQLLDVSPGEWPMLVAALDRLEGHPTHYQRVVTQTRTATGEMVEAWVYLIGRGDTVGMREVPGNDWGNVVPEVAAAAAEVGR